VLVSVPSRPSSTRRPATAVRRRLTPWSRAAWRSTPATTQRPRTPAASRSSTTSAASRSLGSWGALSTSARSKFRCEGGRVVRPLRCGRCRQGRLGRAVGVPERTRGLTACGSRVGRIAMCCQQFVIRNSAEWRNRLAARSPGIGRSHDCQTSRPWHTAMQPVFKWSGLRVRTRGLTACGSRVAGGWLPRLSAVPARDVLDLVARDFLRNISSGVDARSLSRRRSMSVTRSQNRERLHRRGGGTLRRGRPDVSRPQEEQHNSALLLGDAAFLLQPGVEEEDDDAEEEDDDDFWSPSRCDAGEFQSSTTRSPQRRSHPAGVSCEPTAPVSVQPLPVGRRTTFPVEDDNSAQGRRDRFSKRREFTIPSVSGILPARRMV